MKKDRVLNNTLGGLIKKFSENDVIATLEKEYSSRPSRQIPTRQIDDTSFVKNVKIPAETVQRFAQQLIKNGVYSPLVVRPKRSHYELILGRKRYQGGRKAGLTEFPCVIVKASDEEVLLMLLADTRDQREANVVEMALICRELNERYGYTQETLAKLSHQSRSQITNTMRILRLPDAVLDDICLGKLSYGHGKAIASLSQDDITEIVKTIYEKKLSVRETERLVKDRLAGQNQSTGSLISPIIQDESEDTVTLSFASKKEKEIFLKSLKNVR